MCGQFISVPRDTIEEILQEASIRNAVIRIPDWPAISPNAFPGSLVPLITKADNGFGVEEMTWGYSVEWSQRPVFNTRCETALDDERSNMWKDSLVHRRCVIPTFGFFEPHSTEKMISTQTGKEIKQKYYFRSVDESITFLAGIYQDGFFSVMTTEPNQYAAPIHDRMPIVLRQSETEEWFSGAYEALFDRSDIELDVVKIESMQQSLF